LRIQKFGFQLNFVKLFLIFCLSEYPTFILISNFGFIYLHKMAH
jgi:hypothetical protein